MIKNITLPIEDGTVSYYEFTKSTPITMSITKCLFFLAVLTALGCSGPSEDDSSRAGTGGPTAVVYDDDIYKLDEFSVASLGSADRTYLPVPPKLNSWSITGVNRQVEIALKLHSKEPLAPFDDPAAWALFIRTSDNPLGIKYFDDVEVRLFYRYSRKQGLCCINTQPFGSWDQAEASYIPVRGYVDFASDREGFFTMDFQRETAVNSGNLTGPVVTVRGCWRIPGEGGGSGCRL